jgi:hypothetical protein
MLASSREQCLALLTPPFPFSGSLELLCSQFQIAPVTIPTYHGGESFSMRDYRRFLSIYAIRYLSSLIEQQELAYVNLGFSPVASQNSR